MERYTRRRVLPSEAELSLPDLIGLFRKNLPFFLLMVLLFSAAAVALVLLLPRQYEKRVSLAVAPVTSTLLGRFVQEPGDLLLNEPRPEDVGEQIADYLQGAGPKGVETSAKYENDSQQVEVVLSSGSKRSVEAAAGEVPDLATEAFREENERTLADVLEGESLRLEREVEVNERVAADLEEEIGSLGAEGTARLEALEQSRVELLTEVAEAELRLRDLEQARKDLPRLASGLISVEVVDESGITRSTSLPVALAAALAAGLVAAVVVTLLRATIRKG
ncbi:MAG: hypothetical protein M3P49_12840 [Actinomycetota bacterium]|nr:hypothetical protein [Actinomycetota bacterium]